MAEFARRTAENRQQPTQQQTPPAQAQPQVQREPLQQQEASAPAANQQRPEELRQAEEQAAREQAEQREAQEKAAREQAEQRAAAEQRDAQEKAAREQAEAQQRAQAQQQQQAAPQQQAPNASTPVQKFQQAWPAILEQLQSSSRVLHSMVANYGSVAGFDGRTLTLAFSNTGPIVNLRNRPDMMQILVGVLCQVAGQQIEVVLTEGGSATAGGGSPKVNAGQHRRPPQQ